MPPLNNPPLLEVLYGLLDPWLFMLSSLYYFPGTILSLLLSRDFSTLLSFPRLQSLWFSSFWAYAGPQVRLNAEKRVLPLLRGCIVSGAYRQASKHDHELVRGVEGVVLEIGPGIGTWVSVFSPAKLEAGSMPGYRMGEVTRVYGVEPNREVHAQLKGRIVAAGLEGVYEIVGRGIEDLGEDGRVERESLDCIVSILCLCGIPEPERNIRELYQYLKPGGRMFVYEHVRATVSWYMVLYQAFVNLFWPIALGGCDLQRDTTTWLKEAGPWSKIDLAKPFDDPWYNIAPKVIGVLTK